MLNQKNKVSIPEQTEKPYVPKGSHPVENGRYLIATNEIERTSFSCLLRSEYCWTVLFSDE